MHGPISLLFFGRYFGWGEYQLQPQKLDILIDSNKVSEVALPKNDK